MVLNNRLFAYAAVTEHGSSLRLVAIVGAVPTGGGCSLLAALDELLV